MVDATSEIQSYLERLFGITRSITGDGNRETLQILQEIVPLTIQEYPSGESVFDWVIPKEWNIKDAWIKNSKGEKLVDFKVSNLHVVSYSMPVDTKMDFKDLDKHLHYLKDLPDAIPYRTSYYNQSWGFCLSYNQYKMFFHDGEEYEICIDSEFKEGSLSIGELLIRGRSSKEHLLSCYICHPSMANDSLSGVVTTAFLARQLLQKQKELEYSYRIVFVPETIGAISYCAQNKASMKKIDSGLVITTCGGNGEYGYKQSFDPEHVINEMVEDVFKENQIAFIEYPFDIRGSDERQYSSQGFRINTVTITKDKYYEYPYYHTSLDNLDFVTSQNINRSLNLYLQLVEKMDKNVKYRNLYPHCEVMLSKHDLYPKTGGAFLPQENSFAVLDTILWSLFYLDGNMELYKLSKKLDISFELLYEVVQMLEQKKILQRCSDD